MDDKQVLIVDDPTHPSGPLGDIIRHSGVNNVLKARGADKAWMMLKNTKVDCIISVYEMKEMSGLALLKLTRREKGFAEIPFFLIDKAFTKIKVLKAGQNGVTGLFVVPLTEKIVREKITQVLENIEEPVIEKAKQLYDHGLELIKQKKYDKALVIFSNLVDRKENPEYYFNIGYIRTSQGKHPEAIEAFSKAAKLDRLFAKAYEEIAKVYKLMGDKENAEKFMDQAAQAHMSNDNVDSAEEILNEVLESGTESLNIFNTMGVVYRKKGDTDSALTHYKKALKVHPDEPYIYYNIGRLYLDSKESSKAKTYFRQALEKDPGFTEAKQVIKAIELGVL